MNTPAQKTARSKRHSIGWAAIAFYLLASTASAFDIAELAFLHGKWQAPIDDTFHGVMQKYFSQPDDGKIFVFTRVSAGEAVPYWDNILIKENDGNITLTQYPEGVKGDTLKLVRTGKDSAVFENPQSSHVSRVSFSKIADASGAERLISAIEGKRPDGTPLDEKFTYSPIPSN